MQGYEPMASILQSRGRIGRLGLAVLYTQVVAQVSGPLLQAATNVAVRQTISNGSVITSLNPTTLFGDADFLGGRFPTGLYQSHASEVSTLTQEMTGILRDYNARIPITLPGIGYLGSEQFNATVVAPGFDISCHTSNSPLRIAMKPADEAFWGTVRVDFDGVLSSPALITVNATFKALPGTSRDTDPWPTCIGEFVQTICYLHSGTTRYSLNVENGNVKLPPATALANATVKLDFPERNEIANFGAWNSTTGLYLRVIWYLAPRGPSSTLLMATAVVRSTLYTRTPQTTTTAGAQ